MYWYVKGEISVIANNKVYTIKDIDYNDEFKLLESSLEKLIKRVDTNIQQFNTLYKFI